jgi:hypothetical protein
MSYFREERCESDFFSGAFGACFFSEDLWVSFFSGAEGAFFVQGGFTVGGVGGVVGGTPPPPPAAAPKSETEAKRRAAARSEVFMTHSL